MTSAIVTPSKMFSHTKNRHCRQSIVAGLSRRNCFAPFIVRPLAAVLIAWLAIGGSAWVQLCYTDSGDAINGGGIFVFDPNTRQTTQICGGGYLGFFGYPIGIVFDGDRYVFVANERCLVKIDLITRQQTIVLRATEDLGMIWSVALAANGHVILATEKALMEVNASTAQAQARLVAPLPQGVHFLALDGKSGGKSREVFVTTARSVAGKGVIGQISRFSLESGEEKLIAEGENLTSPRGIAAMGQDVWVTCCKDPYGNVGEGRVVHVDAGTGEQKVISDGQYLVGPGGIAIQQNGKLIIADDDTGLDTYNATGSKGALVEVDPATGSQTVLLVGHGSWINPLAVAVLPDGVVR